MGLFSDLFDTVGDVVKGTVQATVGLSTAAVALTLGVNERAVRIAVDAGCTTVREIEEYLGLD